MEIQKITEKQITTQLKEDAHILVTQTETIDNQEVEALRRISFSDFVRDNFGAFFSNIASRYSNAETYDEGDYCFYGNQIYRCTTAITTPEEWTAAHWEETELAAQVEDLNDRFRAFAEEIDASERIQDGTISRDKLNAALEAILQKAETAMQPSIYDPQGFGTVGREGGTVDPYTYAQARKKEVETALNTLIEEIRGAYAVYSGDGESDRSDYQNIGDALRGAYTKAMRYANALLVEYEPFGISIVDQLPAAGAADPRTFYLLPKDGGSGYEKYWVIVDRNGVKIWDSFGASSTIIVNELPAVGESDVDYILSANDEFQYYKYIDGQWELIAGNNVTMIKAVYPIYAVGKGAPAANEVDAEEFYNGGEAHYYFDYASMTPYSPQFSNDEYFWLATGSVIANPSASKDYYVYYDAKDLYLHFRYDGRQFVRVGNDTYSKEEIDNIVLSNVAPLETSIGTNRENIATNAANINSLSSALTSLQQTVAGIDTEGVRYSATLTTEDNTNYRMNLIETEDGVETIVSSFLLPATGGGGGQESSTTMVVDKITSSPITATPTDSVVVEIDFSDTDSDGETVDGSYVISRGSTAIMSGNLVQGRNLFDLTEYCSVGTQKFTLTVTDSAGSINLKSWTVQIVDIRLESSFSDRNTYRVGENVNFTYTPYGAVSKTVHVKLDGTELSSVTTAASGTLQSYSLPAQQHGAHLLECWITATINNQEIETEHVFKDIIWYDEESSVPVIGCIYRYDHYGQVSAKQYSTTAINYIVYDPKSTSPTVTLEVDNEEVSSLKLSSTTNIWAYKTDEVGVHVLRIRCGATAVEIRANIEELGYDIAPVTANLQFDFNPTGRSNSAANRLWTDSNNPDVKMTVSNNFDWDNGGYRLDEDGNQYFLVKAGTRAYISYNLFERDPRTAGSEFKVIYRTENVRNASATFLTCLEQQGSTTVGLQMDTHEAVLYSSVKSIKQPYSEEDTIEFEFSVNTIDTEDPDASSFVMLYEDAVAARAMIYNNSYRLYQYTPAPITIGSDDCDVRIYRMKAYSASLSDTDVISNFIADARDSETMIARYERNQITDGNGNVTPESVADACPDLRIIKIECPHFTNDKNDYVKYTNVECIYRNGDRILDNWRFENGYHAGQGTTSNRYGLAGRNIDIIFGFDGQHQVVSKIPLEEDYITKLRLGNGTLYEDGSGKISLTRTSVPNNWFNIKVNIASSENANNALLQKRYNDYLPYKTPAMKRDPFIKNGMEFVNCVVFIKESDPDLTTHREFADTGWHFYAIGNIGDSKKTDNTRVNDPTDMSEFVVEISDNTKLNATFDTGLYLVNGEQTYTFEAGAEIVYPVTQAQWEHPNNTKRAALYNDWDESFEFRYDVNTKDGQTIPSAEIEAQQEISKQVFRDMYEFVIMSSDSDFVNHLSDWFIVESPLYWYVFTERYIMMDNRAKNSFWHWGKVYITEEEAETLGDDAANYTIDNEAAAINNGYRFDLWIYDTDTALGIDNNGEQTRTYGMEDIDRLPSGVPVFNASESVFWRRIRNLMGSQVQRMYQSRESLNCWTASSLIQEFDAWQSQFPEELWRLDIERKYLRPYYTGNPVAGIDPTNSFLEDMMNGCKKYQRRQFERNQEIYTGTKYFGSNQCADTRAISFRCNTPSGAAVPPDYTLRIVPYSDMYLSVAYGNSTPQQIRSKAGQEYVFTTAMTTMDETQVLINCGENIMALNDLSACYIHANNFSNAKKIKTLIIGSNEEGYSNPYIEMIGMGNNTLLETLDIRNCPNLTGTLNLSSCVNLETLLAEGTSVASVTFAPNGAVQTAHLPDTLTSLQFRNILHLNDLQIAGYDNLESFVCAYSNIDALSILREASDTLRSIRALGIDWILPETDLLNACIAMNSSELSGEVYISGSIRQRELDAYEEAWPDLEVSYDPANMVTQYLATYVNADGTTLYTAYVDRGSAPPDPVALGLIDTPTRESTAQYSFTYSGWDDVESAMLSARTITAQYTESVRQYTIRFYSRAGLLLETQTASYGDEVVYSGATPINTVGQEQQIYNLFAGWDKSTGYITGDLDVYAVWESAAAPVTGTELKDMTWAQVNAIAMSKRASEFFTDKDRISLKMGNDFNFSNVEAREIIATPRYFDGTDTSGTGWLDTNIKLFDTDSPSFTLAMDYEFLNTNAAGATLVACYNEDGSEGFRLRYTGGHPSIMWGDRNLTVGNGPNRNITVIRHRKGERNLYVYTFNLTDQNYDLELSSFELVRTRDTSTDQTLTFGAVRFANGGHDYFGKGWLHWCKIWYEDLGENVAKSIAAWPRETLEMEYTGADRYRLSGQTSERANASFMSAGLLPLLSRFNATSTNAGGWDESELRTKMQRFMDGLPQVVRSALKQVSVPASAGNQSFQIVMSLDKVYLASNIEVNSAVATQSTTPYPEEGETISFYTNNQSRVKFCGLVISEDAQIITSNTDPTAMTSYNVSEGDIWINTASSSNGFYYISAETAAKHSKMGFRLLTNGDNIQAQDGGVWVRSYGWWLRSPSAADSAYFVYVYTSGSVYDYDATYAGGVAPCFSI